MSGTFNRFVYGSLRSGHSANAMLKDCTLIGDATVNGILYDIDSRFTAVILYGETPVHGELWRCPAPLLLALDTYESVSSGLFRRVATHASANGRSEPCWLYVAGPGLSRKLTPERRVESSAPRRRHSGDTNAE